MENFKGRVAVVTGAASGIGRALAERFAEEGMKIVLADVEAPALDKAEAEMKADGADVLSVQTDVSKSADLDALAEKTLSAYSKVDILCNNAGVAVGGPCWSITESDWEWVMGVNLWGVINGLRSFVPIMMKNSDGGHIVNTGSMSSFTAPAGMAPYATSKHGILALSECLFHDLEQAGSSINVSVLCPGWVNTNIAASSRNRPEGPISNEDLDPTVREHKEAAVKALEDGLAPKEVAEEVLGAIAEQRFYVLPEPQWKSVIQARVEDIINDRDPGIPVPPQD